MNNLYLNRNVIKCIQSYLQQYERSTPEIKYIINNLFELRQLRIKYSIFLKDGPGRDFKEEIYILDKEELEPKNCILCQLEIEEINKRHNGIPNMSKQSIYVWKNSSLQNFLFHLLLYHQNRKFSSVYDSQEHSLNFTYKTTRNIQDKYNKQDLSCLFVKTENSYYKEFFKPFIIDKLNQLFNDKNACIIINQIYGEFYTVKVRKNGLSNNFKEDKIQQKYTKEEIKKIFKALFQEKNIKAVHSYNIQQEISSESLFEESEFEIDESPIMTLKNNMINDFEDISQQDKTFFNLWNNFISNHKGFNNQLKLDNGQNYAFTKADHFNLLKKFVINNREIIEKENLRISLALVLKTIYQNKIFYQHFATLQDYDIINSDEISQLFEILDNHDQQFANNN